MSIKKLQDIHRATHPAATTMRPLRKVADEAAAEEVTSLLAAEDDEPSPHGPSRSRQ